MKYKVILVKKMDDFLKLGELKKDSLGIVIIKNDLDFHNIKSYSCGEAFMKRDEIFPINLVNSSLVIYGNNHVIENLNIEAQDHYVGMFSKIRNLYLKNLEIKNAHIKAMSVVGIVAADVLDKIKVNNCVINGTVTADTHVGSIAGLTNVIDVIDTDVYTEIKANDYVGGLVGQANELKTKRTAVYSFIDAPQAKVKGREFAKIHRQFLQK